MDLNDMTIKDAIRILHPQTSADAISEIKHYNSGDISIKYIQQACIIACNAMEELLRLKEKIGNITEDIQIMESEAVKYGGKVKQGRG